MKPGKIIHTWKTKKGNQAVIRVIKSSDLINLLNFVNELIKEDTFVQLSGAPLTLSYERKYLIEAIKKVKKDQKIHLVVDVNGNFAGSCEVRIFEKRKSHVGEIGISLGKNFRDEGIGTVCLITLISEARKLGLKLITLNCFEINQRAIHTYEKIGFKTAGVIPGMLYYKKKYQNEQIMYINL
jgi:RimJ/RimL family protein N-acetyltransferase